MNIVQSNILYIAQKMGLILRDPIFYLLAITVIYLYTRQIKRLQETHDEKKYIVHSVTNILIGTCIGVGVSWLLSRVGMNIVLTTQVIILIPLAMGMMLMSPKLGCFSYVVAGAYIIEGTLKLLGMPSYTLHYEPLIFLVGLLHLIEGILIMAAGDRLAIQLPVYEKGKLVSAQIFNQIWLIPLIFQVQGMPIPIYTLLAYGDIATNKRQKWLTGGLVMGYGIMLLVLQSYQVRGSIPLGGLMILMPVCHELIFVLSHGDIKVNKKVDN